MNPGGIGIISALIVLAMAIAIVTFIGAVFLGTAVGIYNLLVGGAESPSSVPQPDYGRSMAIIFLSSLINGGVGFLVAFSLARGGVAAGLHENELTVGLQIANLIIFLLGLLIMAMMVAVMLPTTFVRALLVTLCYHLILVIVVVAIVVCVVACGHIPRRG